MAKDKTPAQPPVLQQELGTLEVAEPVFQDLFVEAVADLPGVASLRREPGGLFSRGGQAVRVERGGGEVAFSVCLSVHYDVNIPKLAGELRERASAALEQVTGYKVRAVNVTIDHILPPQPPRPEQEPPAGDNVPEMPPVPDEE